MKYAGLIKNDFSATKGVSVTFFSQGCPHKCPGCHNPATWDFNGGKEFSPNIIDEIIEALTAQGINRNFCIMGGEPLCPENEFLTMLLIKEVRNKLPEVPIYVWTGYTLEELQYMGNKIKQILSEINYLIDGLYIQELRDITLEMRGSSNQRIINIKEIDNFEKI